MWEHFDLCKFEPLITRSSIGGNEWKNWNEPHRSGLSDFEMLIFEGII